MIINNLLSINKSLYIKTYCDGLLLKGYLFFITDKSQLMAIKPHEAIIPEKKILIEQEIIRQRAILQPLLCVVKSLPRMMVQYANKTCIVETVDDFLLQKIINNSDGLLLADGHHRFAALQNQEVWNAIVRVPIFIVAATAIKCEPFVHFALVNKDVNYLINEYLTGVNANNHPYSIEIIHKGKTKHLSFKNIDELIAIRNKLFEQSHYINYMPWSQWRTFQNNIIPHNMLVVKMPQLKISDIFSLVNDKYLLPQHSTSFYPKPQANLLHELISLYGISLYGSRNYLQSYKYKAVPSEIHLKEGEA